MHTALEIGRLGNEGNYIHEIHKGNKSTFGMRRLQYTPRTARSSALDWDPFFEDKVSTKHVGTTTMTDGEIVQAGRCKTTTPPFPRSHSQESVI